MAQRTPELDARRHALLQLERALVERDRLVQLVARRGELCRPGAARRPPPREAASSSSGRSAHARSASCGRTASA